jgi:hypothetical protein
MQLGQTQTYLNGLEALNRLRDRLGKDEDLKAIAKLFLYSKQCEVPTALFGYVGDPADERDEAIVRAYEREWQRLVKGEDDDFD